MDLGIVTFMKKKNTCFIYYSILYTSIVLLNKILDLRICRPWKINIKIYFAILVRLIYIGGAYNLVVDY